MFITVRPCHARLQLVGVGHGIEALDDVGYALCQGMLTAALYWDFTQECGAYRAVAR